MKKFRALIIILILAGLGVWYYNYLDARKAESKSEEVVSEIDKIINELEANEVSLEESFNLYKKGMELIKNCNDDIEKVQKQLIVLQQKDEQE